MAMATDSEAQVGTCWPDRMRFVSEVLMSFRQKLQFGGRHVRASRCEPTWRGQGVVDQSEDYRSGVYVTCGREYPPHLGPRE